MNLSVKTLLVAASCLFASHSYALTINGGATEVGDLDSIVALTNTLGNSGDATELAWVESVLGLTSGSLGFGAKTEDTDADWSWTQLDGPDYSTAYAFDLLTDPGYFLIKIGTGGLADANPEHFLYQNNQSNAFAVVDLLDLCPTCSSFNNFTIDRLSHIGEIGAASVPEPGTLALFGLGLLGLALGRKKIS